MSLNAAIMGMSTYMEFKAIRLKGSLRIIEKRYKY